MRNTAERWPVGGEDVAYGHSTGRLRVLETRLLTAVQLDQVVRQGSTAVGAQLLDSLAYPEGSDLLERIAAGRQEADELLVALCSDKPLAYGLLLYQCYHNLKVFLKALLPTVGQEMDTLRSHNEEAVPERISDLLFWGSPEKPVALWQCVLRVIAQETQVPVLASLPCEWSATDVGLDELGPDSYLRTKLPPVFLAAVEAARLAYAKVEEVGRIDAVLDYYYFAHLSALARLAKQPFLKTYATLRADLANLNALYRIRRLGLAKEMAELFWLPGGQVKDREEFVSLLDAPLATWRETFEQTPAVELAELAYQLAQGDRSLTNAEDQSERRVGAFARKADNLLMDLARTGLSVIYGPQVVAGYWLARQTEAQNLRLLVSLQAQQKSVEEQINLLREVYIHG